MLTATAPVCQAAAVVNVGGHILLGNQANQTFTVLVTGTDQVAGEDFFAQIGDGGAFNNGTNTGPKFQKVDLLTGTIFATNNLGATGDPNGVPKGSNAGHPLLWVDGTQTGANSVSDTGILATFTIDTTNTAPGTYPLLLTGVASKLGGFDTKLRDGLGVPIPLTINNGSITVLATPEPASLSLLFGLGLLATRRRRASR